MSPDFNGLISTAGNYCSKEREREIKYNTSRLECKAALTYQVCRQWNQSQWTILWTHDLPNCCNISYPDHIIHKGTCYSLKALTLFTEWEYAPTNHHHPPCTSWWCHHNLLTPATTVQVITEQVTWEKTLLTTAKRDFWLSWGRYIQTHIKGPKTSHFA